MTLTSLRSNSDTEALLQACVSFDPSDASHRVVIQMMVMPMLRRRLELLQLAARVAPASGPIQSAIQEIEAALSTASARLDRMPQQDKEAGRKKQTRG